VLDSRWFGLALPTTEALLRVFQDIAPSIVTIGVQVRRHITPLSDLQRRIHDLLNIPLGMGVFIASASLSNFLHQISHRNTV
jgi:hypothetical protein